MINETGKNVEDKLSIPGAIVETTPQEAEEMGAFEETALSQEDAEESRFDNEIEPE